MPGDESKKKFEAKLSNLQSMMELIQSSAELVGFDKKDMNKIQLASEEALVNVISYAYPKDAPGVVEITCIANVNKTLVITIQDQGLEFNPLEHQDVDTTAPLEERYIGGLGIFFFLQTMDRLDYSRNGNFNTLTMLKNFSPR